MYYFGVGIPKMNVCHYACIKVHMHMHTQVSCVGLILFLLMTYFCSMCAGFLLEVEQLEREVDL